MVWRSKQLAELAGITQRTLRHWHQIGLLPEPERQANNYRRYTARHLVLTLRIKRLALLGFELTQIADLLESDEQGRVSLQGLRDELTGRIQSLEATRAEVDRMLAIGVAPDLLPEAMVLMEFLGADQAGRSMAIVLTHLVSAGAAASLLGLFTEASPQLSEIHLKLSSLAEDAPSEQIAELVEKLSTAIDGLPALAANRAEGRATAHDHLKMEAFFATATEGMNAAQREVLSSFLESR